VAAKNETRPQAIDLSIAVAGETRTLQGIHFQGGSSWILPQSCDALDSLFLALRQAPAVRIRIEGHVCCMELHRTAEHQRSSEKLSEERARTIYSFLVEQGIAADRLEYAGFGFSRPLVSPELTEEDRINNRRVDIRIIQ
jgi:outer membrane protein OmpA-like peptidoglycan-associated protein